MPLSTVAIQSQYRCLCWCRAVWTHHYASENVTPSGELVTSFSSNVRTEYGKNSYNYDIDLILLLLLHNFVSVEMTILKRQPQVNGRSFPYFIFLWITFLFTKINRNVKQECIPVGCIPPALPPYGGSLCDRDPPDRNPPPGQIPPWTETPPVNRITDRCKNITFPQLRLRAVMKWNRHPILLAWFMKLIEWSLLGLKINGNGPVLLLLTLDKLGSSQGPSYDDMPFDWMINKKKILFLDKMWWHECSVWMWHGSFTEHLKILCFFS